MLDDPWNVFFGSGNAFGIGTAGHRQRIGGTDAGNQQRPCLQCPGADIAGGAIRPAVAGIQRLTRLRTAARQAIAKAHHTGFGIQAEHIGWARLGDWGIVDGDFRARGKDVIDFLPFTRPVAGSGGEAGDDD